MLSRLPIQLSRRSATGPGTGGRRFAEPQEDLVAVADHVVEGEADDAAERLGVKQDQGPCDAGPERQVVAGQDTAELAHSLVVGERCRVADHRGGQPEAPGDPAGHAPLEKGPDGEAGVLVVLGVPGVDVGLAAVGQGQAAPGKPPEEGGGALEPGRQRGGGSVP